MGKYDHICELTGAENHSQWRRQMTLALKGERLWDHCSSGTDVTDLAELASTRPAPANPSTIQDDEREKILDWLAKDARAKARINQKVSTVVASQLGDSQTAREQWESLAQRYSYNNLMSQYELRARVRSEKLTDAEDAPRYLGVFQEARRRFIQLGVTYFNDEAIFDLLQGLPDTIEWQIFKELTLDRLSGVTTTSANTSTSSPSPGTGIATSASQPLTFDSVAKLLTAKAHAIVGKRNLAGPGLEGASAAIVQSTNTRIHSATGSHTHRNNARGVRYTSYRCACLPRADNHNIEHCYWPGEVMEEKAPA